MFIIPIDFSLFNNKSIIFSNYKRFFYKMVSILRKTNTKLAQHAPKCCTLNDFIRIMHKMLT